jgi:hypothetical protein
MGRPQTTIHQAESQTQSADLFGAESSENPVEIENHSMQQIDGFCILNSLPALAIYNNPFIYN